MQLAPVRIFVLVSLAAAVAHPAAAGAQDFTINDRFDNRTFPPRSQADGYMGLTMGQLIVALGLTLQGVPATAQRDDETRIVQKLHSLWEASPHRRAGPPREADAAPSPGPGDETALAPAISGAAR
jgi:hypothetical protein